MIEEPRIILPGPAGGSGTSVPVGSGLLPIPAVPSTPVESETVEDRLKKALEKIEALRKENEEAWEKVSSTNKQIDVLEERLREAKAKLKTLEERDHRLTEFLNAWDRLRGVVKIPGPPSEPAVSSAALGKWLERAGKRNACRRMLETLIEHREVSRSQLGTLSIVSARGSSFRNSMGWLKKNGLISVKGDQVRLICP